jgi:hypothetical protein
MSWYSRLRTNYKSFEEFKSYDEHYGLAARLNFSSAQEAWDMNPQITGSTNPADFRRALEPMRFHQTYEIVTDESAEEGDVAESGFDWEDDDFTFRELVHMLEREYIGAEPSESRGVPRWVTSYGDRDMREGHFRNISLHPANDRAKRWWGRALVAAEIIKQEELTRG